MDFQWCIAGKNMKTKHYIYRKIFISNFCSLKFSLGSFHVTVIVGNLGQKVKKMKFHLLQKSKKCTLHEQWDIIHNCNYAQTWKQRQNKCMFHLKMNLVFFLHHLKLFWYSRFFAEKANILAKNNFYAFRKEKGRPFIQLPKYTFHQGCGSGRHFLLPSQEFLIFLWMWHSEPQYPDSKLDLDPYIMHTDQQPYFSFSAKCVLTNQ